MMNLINIPFNSHVSSEKYIAKYRHFHSVLCINLMFVHKLQKLATSMDLSICNTEYFMVKGEYIDFCLGYEKIITKIIIIYT